MHVYLDVPAAELRRRIDAQVLIQDDPETDASARAFRHRNVDRCVAARDDLPPGTLILRADQHTPAQLAELVLTAWRTTLLTARAGDAVRRIASRYLGRDAGAAFADSAVADLVIRLEPGELRAWDFADQLP